MRNSGEESREKQKSSPLFEAIRARDVKAFRKMLAKGIDQSRLRNDPGTAAALELQRWRLDGGGFGALRKVQGVWYERGRDKGLAFDLLGQHREQAAQQGVVGQGGGGGRGHAFS